ALAGFDCVVVDTDPYRVRAIREQRVPLPGFESRVPLADALDAGLEVAEPGDEVATGDVHIVCVNTDRNGEPYLESLINVVHNIAADRGRRSDPETLVVIESTVSPRWLSEHVAPVLGAGMGGLHLATAPRRDWMLSSDLNLRTLPRVIGAERPSTLPALNALYSTVSDQIHVAPDWEHAALTKAVENVFRFVDLVLANQLADAFPSLDVSEVLRLAGTKFNMPTYHPSLGIGGYCIPLSPHFVNSAVSDEALPVVTAALESHRGAPSRVAERLTRLARGPIGVLGVSYAQDARILQGSVTAPIIRELVQRGRQVAVNDPYFSEEEVVAATSAEVLEYPEGLGSLDVLVVATPHAQYANLTEELERLDRPPLVVDSLGSYREQFAITSLPYIEWGTPDPEEKRV
ncbi:UDP binding domain-containing protein, partial [Brachybacterium alimentarium]|uniref:UDP binding domain-containing protein n=1 Tax=Brachybacterium alimentarium TaxID=47845 RepID=UPI003FD14602